MMWIAIMLFMFILAILGIVYIIKNIAKTAFIKSRFEGKRAYSISAAIVGVCAVVIFIVFGMWDAMVVFIHLLVFWILTDVLFGFVQKKRNGIKNASVVGIVAVCVTTIYLAIGVFFGAHVFRTEYNVSVDKTVKEDDFKIVGFSDSHVGTTFHGKKFSKYVQQMNNENADSIVIVGDFVDDSTSLEDMLKACEELGALKAKYGVYYVFGNHDCGYYANERRGYGKAELVDNLEKNNIKVLEDEVINIKDNVYLCARKDKSMSGRKSMKELLENHSVAECMIVLDHQPGDYKAQEEAKVDLVLSGHTHGGQYLPIIMFGEWMGINDMTYGLRTKEDTNFIVSSGISDWETIFKTGCISEYFVVNLKSK